ncbi:hypothetical protein ACFST9_01760 [Hymenobacter monticola]|uniref:Uncharacterized protein n=1 Tax=Hymenobacter monticola TaxID=1705399 RepID=A0ABY4B2G0_9BACT|nr:hypothetical protein [Hymenobacter monticola]UOE33312.1 hypothetical protein MTP16_19570 [Hymenobacter monticola]
MSQLLPLVGPAGTDAGSPPATASIITIQKVKLKDQHLTCEFTEQRTQDAPPRAFALTCAEQVHPDLPHALSRLVPHLCLLTEQLTETPDFWPDVAEELPARFEAFTVTGFSMGKGQGGVTLIGQRALTGNKVLNLTSPYVSFTDETDAAYPYAPLLETELAEALTEVEAALRGKCTEYRQLDLFEQPGSASTLLVSTRPEA